MTNERLEELVEEVVVNFGETYRDEWPGLIKQALKTLAAEIYEEAAVIAENWIIEGRTPFNVTQEEEQLFLKSWGNGVAEILESRAKALRGE